MSLYKSLIRPILFKLDPEHAHQLAMRFASIAKAQPIATILDKIHHLEDVRLSQERFGLTFKNPIGLSAGADKNCQACELFSSFGFGFLESVSFTYLPQEGNPRPRIFRIPESEALINRLGFPSLGAEALAPRIQNAKKYLESKKVVFGVNFAKSKSVPIEEAVEDYLRSFKLMRSLADYIVLNVSSPNTPGLRELQKRNHLEEIISALQDENITKIPLLVKIAPDLDLSQIDEVIQTCLDHNIQGIVATNSTITRDGITSHQNEAGGLSGRPLFLKSLKIVEHIRRQVSDKLCIIGVGGIFSAQDAISMFQAGASLIEIYTALVYEGPNLIYQIKKGILEYLEQHKIPNISGLIGSKL